MEPQVDPVSGNPVPPGASPEEVRDDVDAKLSSGEYVLPADVVRFLGVEKIESLVKKAKDQLAQLAGGGEDELPFSPEELQAMDAPEPQQEPVRMAQGGLVQPRSIYDPVGSALPGSVAEEDETRRWETGNPNRAGREGVDRPTGLGGPVGGWSTANAMTYANNVNNPALGYMDGVISALPGIGQLAVNMKNKYTPDQVTSRLEQSLKDNVDFEGNPLSAEMQSKMQGALDSIKNAKPRETSLTKGVMNEAATALGIDKELGMVRDAVSAVKNPIGKLKEAVTAPVKDAIKGVVAGVKTNVKEALNTTKTKAQQETESGVVSRRDSTTQDKTKESEKSDKGKSSEGNKGGKSSGGGTSFGKDKNEKKK